MRSTSWQMTFITSTSHLTNRVLSPCEYKHTTQHILRLPHMHALYMERVEQRGNDALEYGLPSHSLSYVCVFECLPVLYSDWVS